MNDRIKALRARHAMTQEDLAAKAGVGVATVQRAERGQRPGPNTLASIAAAFGVPAAYLGGDEADAETFEPYLPLDRMVGGRRLVSLLRSGPGIDFGFCELDDLDDARAIELFHDSCREVAAQSGPLTPVAQVIREIELKNGLARLADRGFMVGAAGFEVRAYDVDDDAGTGMGIVFGQWDERRTALRVGRTLDEISRAHVLGALGRYESVNGGLVHPPTPPDDGDRGTPAAFQGEQEV